MANEKTWQEIDAIKRECRNQGKTNALVEGVRAARAHGKHLAHETLITRAYRGEVLSFAEKNAIEAGYTQGGEEAAKILGNVQELFSACDMALVTIAKLAFFDTAAPSYSGLVTLRDEAANVLKEVMPLLTQIQPGYMPENRKNPPK